MKITFCRLTRTECAIYVGSYLLSAHAHGVRYLRGEVAFCRAGRWLEASVPWATQRLVHYFLRLVQVLFLKKRQKQLFLL